MPIRVDWYEVEGVPKAKLVFLGFRFAIIIGEKPKLDAAAGELQPAIIIFDQSLKNKSQQSCMLTNDK